MRTNTVLLIITGIVLVLFGINTAILFTKREPKTPKIIVRDVVTPVGGWPDYGFNTWRRGGRPWKRQGRRHHTWKRGGGARKSRPIA